MWNAKVFTNFLQSQSYACSRELGSKPFHVTFPNSHQGYNEYSLKKPPANGYFLFFYLALCAHETCFMTRPWKRMVCMYFCQQQASQHNTVVAGKSLYFCWKRKRKRFLVRGLFQNCHMGYLNESFYAWSWV